jgi:HD-like signal output (HDOD) protein
LSGHDEQTLLRKDANLMPATPVALEPEQIVKIMLSKIGDIATLPEVTAKIIGAVDDPKSTAHDLHKIIKNDPALATKIVKVVNSAFYGLPGQVSDLDRAIVLLGLSAVKNIAISASISRLFTAEKISDQFSARDIWRHSVGVAVATRQFCSIVGKKGFAEEAFLSGLIHDLGLLIERQSNPEQLAEIISIATKREKRFEAIETEVLGVDHQVLGAALAAKWKFPRALQSVMGYHHRVDLLSPENRFLPVVVHIADTLCCHDGIGFYLTAAEQQVDTGLLESVGLSEANLTTVRETLSEQVEQAEGILMGG